MAAINLSTLRNRLQHHQGLERPVSIPDQACGHHTSLLFLPIAEPSHLDAAWVEATHCAHQEVVVLQGLGLGRVHGDLWHNWETQGEWIREGEGIREVGPGVLPGCSFCLCPHPGSVSGRSPEKRRKGKEVFIKLLISQPSVQPLSFEHQAQLFLELRLLQLSLLNCQLMVGLTLSNNVFLLHGQSQTQPISVKAFL